MSEEPHFGFRCTGCGAWHTGVPAYHLAGPSNLFAIPEEELAERCIIETDACVIDRSEFYVRGLIEIPVRGADEPFVWGVWVSLSQASFAQWVDAFELRDRAHIGPFFGWLASDLDFYPRTLGLKTRVHLRNDFRRPMIELEPTQHPLAVEQREGIGVERLTEIVAFAESHEPPGQMQVKPER